MLKHFKIEHIFITIRLKLYFKIIVIGFNRTWIEFYNSIGLKFISRKTKMKIRSDCLKLKKNEIHEFLNLIQ